MNINFRTGLSSFALLLLLMGCQPRVWQATITQAKSDVPIDNTLATDPQLEATIVPYRQQLYAKMSEVLGTSVAELSRGDYQSPLGDFVLNLMLEKTRKVYDKPVDFTVTNRDGLRMALPKGEIRMEHAYGVMPFDNEIVVLTLDGKTVKELFDFAAEKKYVLIGNATYTIQNGKATNITIAGKPFDPNRTYKVVTTDYLAGGGDYMEVFTRSLKNEKVGVIVRDAIIEKIRNLNAQGLPVTPDTSKNVILLP